MYINIYMFMYYMYVFITVNVYISFTLAHRIKYCED